MVHYKNQINFKQGSNEGIKKRYNTQKTNNKMTEVNTFLQQLL